MADRECSGLSFLNIFNIQCNVPVVKSLTWVMTGGSDKTVLGVCSLNLASRGCFEVIRTR
jgi:hypothetical protein